MYERGAWLRVYGTPVYALTENFFKLCVADCGRFIRADDCTIDKARFDYGRILISTQILEVLNTSSTMIIDGSEYTLRLVEDWGCNLGEEAFLTEDGEETQVDAVSHHSDVPDLEEVRGDMEVLINDLQHDLCPKDQAKDVIDQTTVTKNANLQHEVNLKGMSDKQHDFCPKDQAHDVIDQTTATMNANLQH